MTDANAENSRLAGLLRLLLEAETGEDSMICHDGGFRYSGDFMSMEHAVIEPAGFLDPEDVERLRERCLIEDAVDQDGGIRVTGAGRRLAFRSAPIDEGEM